MKKTSPKSILFLACLMFVVLGMFTSSIGPVLGEFSDQTNSSLAVVGGVLTFLFLGAWVSQLIVGPLMDRIGRKPILIAAMLILAAGIILYVNIHSLVLLFGLFFLTGLGQGALVLSVNLLAVDAYPEKSTTSLNLLNFIFGIGAFSGPALVSLAIRLKATGLLIQLILAGLFVCLAIVVFAFYHEARDQKAAAAKQSTQTRTNLYRSPLIWMLGLMVLVYVGSELGLGSWATTFMNASAGMPTQDGALVTSAFWGALALGRLAGTLVSRKLGMLKQLAVAITGAMLSGIIFTLLMGRTTLQVIALITISFFFGTIYPTAIAVTTRLFPEDQGKAYGLVGAMGSMGGLTLPWLAGIVLEKISPASFTLYIAVLTMIVFLFYIVVRLQIKKRNLTV